MNVTGVAAALVSVGLAPGWRGSPPAGAGGVGWRGPAAERGGDIAGAAPRLFFKIRQFGKMPTATGAMGARWRNPGYPLPNGSLAEIHPKEPAAGCRARLRHGIPASASGCSNRCTMRPIMLYLLVFSYFPEPFATNLATTGNSVRLMFTSYGYSERRLLRGEDRAAGFRGCLARARIMRAITRDRASCARARLTCDRA